MECQPLGINATLVTAGFVKTNIIANARPHFHLPENTLYSSYVTKIYESLEVGRGSGSSVTGADVFAEKVAKETMKRNPPRNIYIGGQSVLFRFFMWLPRVLVLMFLWKKA